MEPITNQYSQNCVICLKIGDAYSAEYVNNLYHAVRKQCDWNFLCFTDDPTGIDLGVICHHMDARESEGWWPTWSKIEIFGRKEIKRYSKKVYFDLDLVIQGDIQCILDHEAEWAAIRATWKGLLFRVKNLEESVINTSVMVWKDISWIYEKWEANWKDIVKKYRGTDKWYHMNGISPTFLPDVFYSYREGSKPKHYWENNYQPHFQYYPDYSVCLFHQKPDIHELDKDKQLYKIWNAAVS